MDGIAIWILGAILATTQSLSAVYIAYLKRGHTKAQAHNETADAFSTLTQTVSQIASEYSGNLTKMAADYSTTITKMITIIDARENKMDALEEANRQKSRDLEDLRKQYSELVATGAAQGRELDLMREAVQSLKTANGNQASELFDVKAELTKLREENIAKESAIQERESQLADRDKRIEELEGKVLRLETELALLKPPIAPAETLAMVAKPDGENPT